MEGIIALLVVAVVLFFYFLPAILASDRKHNNKLAILMLNLLLGWTLLGWVIAMVWACTNNVKS